MGFWKRLFGIKEETPAAPRKVEEKKHDAKPHAPRREERSHGPKRDDRSHGPRREDRPHGPKRDDRPAGPRRDSAPHRSERPARKFEEHKPSPPPYTPVEEPLPAVHTNVTGESAFAQFGLRAELVQAIRDMGFEKPTVVQERSIPAVMKGTDVLVSAQTGSGKTVAFGLPILESLLANPPASQPSVLVLAPTRELAAQVAVVFKEMGRHTKLRGTLICGGMDFDGQNKQLKAGVDVIVATPGRLLDHMRRGTIAFKGLRTLVLDEADRMLDMGFAFEISEIMHRLPKQRQTLLFSATLPAEVQQLSRLSLNAPVYIAIDRVGKPAEGVTQKMYPVMPHQKQDLFVALMKATPRTSTLVFTNTKVGADRLVRVLENQGIRANPLHADRTQSQRDATLKRFREKQIDLVVATDVAARGLDVKEISHVVNYDIPHFPEDYVHRIGRTARAFSVGEALTLVTPEEEPRVIAIQRFIGQDIVRAALEAFPYLLPPRLDPPKPKSFADVFAHKRRKRIFKRR